MPPALLRGMPVLLGRVLGGDQHFEFDYQEFTKNLRLMA
jgi:hypothetical protein